MVTSIYLKKITKFPTHILLLLLYSYKNNFDLPYAHYYTSFNMLTHFQELNEIINNASHFYVEDLLEVFNQNY